MTIKQSPQDEIFIKEALLCAKKGLGWTNPNPMVGALIVKQGKIISQGYHKKAGLPHAEIEAISLAKKKVKGATLYLNLEPCCHFGKTPPCVPAIIKAGIKRVVCSSLDPNPKVNGKGIAELKKAGIEVRVSILDKENRKLNEAFFTFHEKKRPFVAIKFAATLDGKIATKTGESKWITNEEARRYARLLRSQYQAVLVGINTVLKDNPRLTAREKNKPPHQNWCGGKKEPIRIILDSALDIPLKSQVLADSNVIIATLTKKINREKKLKLREKGVSILEFPGKKISIQRLLQKLYKEEIISILVEGGSITLGSFFDQGLVDKVYAFFAPILIGGKNAITPIAGQGTAKIKDGLRLKELTLKKFGDNFLLTGYANQ
ncbi:MAG: riboflavin biosynthesis protein RibD [Candidatus Nealsonbacteria bacterium CG08_land_8_20_14_0_20_38_20]|uniref:Riboflavin biosynthesis protein RibD n=1 Tax=Candidatus Nealsonbacteria bacterium CG08_land_8_20_14_0_20_38_20 TaxID=1974705 RepID=A0A2H0YNQ9_9BACT|nr:MAG: riboflavin biosynthesis protein RibD [Candidatus Nealsonbacteria bacterium CG08_land_8_20_14_0_20_38_20]